MLFCFYSLSFHLSCNPVAITVVTVFIFCKGGGKKMIFVFSLCLFLFFFISSQFFFKQQFPFPFVYLLFVYKQFWLSCGVVVPTDGSRFKKQFDATSLQGENERNFPSSLLRKNVKFWFRSWVVFAAVFWGFWWSNFTFYFFTFYEFSFFFRLTVFHVDFF